MNSANLSKKELNDIIFFSLKENDIDVKEINASQIKSILADYYQLCYRFNEWYVGIGELDTFKRASCLLSAINRGSLSKDKYINASIAVDAAYKMCEKPYYNVGVNFDEPKKLEEVDFQKAFENDMDVYTTSKNMMVDSLFFEKNKYAPFLTYYINLELFYQKALKIKHQSIIDKPDVKTKKLLKD